jgi:predicted TIM-barrel fold metal-dependent hydrolase
MNPQGVDMPADLPALLEVYDLAAAAGVPITVHLDYEEGDMDSFDTALEHNRDTIFIWAHSGDAPPEVVGSFLDRHPNLHADLSCRNPFYLPRYTFTEEQSSIAELDRVSLRADWQLVLEEHSDRFLFGTDIGPGDRDSQINEVVSWYQDMLGQLDREHAEAIANGNARRLFALE